MIVSMHDVHSSSRLSSVDAGPLRHRYVTELEEVSRPAFVASQLDWRRLRENHTEMWLECARATFASLGPGPDGAVAVEQLLGLLREKLHDDDVDLAIEEAMLANCAESYGVTFDDFVRLLSADGGAASGAHGDPASALYDTRYVGSPRAAEAAPGEADEGPAECDERPCEDA